MLLNYLDGARLILKYSDCDSYLVIYYQDINLLHLCEVKKYFIGLNCVTYVKQIILQYKPCLTHKIETRCKACQLVIFGWLLCGCQGVAKQLVEHSGWLLELLRCCFDVLKWLSVHW